MKWMIASDIHGSAYYCEKLIEAYHREEADRLLLLGDILYHGPRNDLPRDYAPKKVIGMLNERKQDILCVRGNCDTEVDQMVLQFPVLADYVRGLKRQTRRGVPAEERNDIAFEQEEGKRPRRRPLYHVLHRAAGDHQPVDGPCGGGSRR